MTFGNALDPTTEQDFYTDRFKEAKNELQSWPALKSAFGSVSYPEDSELTSNPLFLELAAIDRGDSTDDRIERINSALAEVQQKLTVSDRRELSDALTSGDSRIVLSRVFELLAYHYFSTTLGLPTEPEPSLSTGGQCDLLVKDTHKVYVELTRLGNASTERAIEDVFEKASEELLSEISADTMLNLQVDTSQLVWDNTKTEALQRSASKNEILDHFERAHLNTFLEDHRSVSLQDIQKLEGNRTVQDLVDENLLPGVNQYTKMGTKLNSHHGEPRYAEVFQSDVTDFEGPIVHAILGSSNGKLVEIHDKSVYPSNVASEQKRIFKTRLKDNVKSKIDKCQREPGEVNLLFLSASNWLFRGFGRNPSRPLAEGLKPEIVDGIRSVLNETQPEDLIGVGVVEDELSQGMYIDNPHTSSDVQSKFTSCSISSKIGS